jgi:Uncharacterized protein conserved in bacteria
MRNLKICSLLVSICFLNLLCTKPSASTQSENPFLKSDKQSISVNALAGRDTLTINCNTDWSIINLPSWTNASTMNGSKGETTVIIQCSANESTNQRAGDITFKSSDNSVDQLNVHFSQAGASLFLSSDKTNFSENPSGQADSATITSNCSWSIDPPSAESGIVVDKTSGDAGTTRVHFNLAANNSSSQKITDLKIQTTNGSASLNLHFIQDINSQISSSTLPGNSPHKYGISFVYDNKIYYGLGIDEVDNIYSYNFDVYEPQTNHWTKSIPIALAMHPNKYSSCFILNNMVYMGFGTYKNPTDWWSYDPSKTGDGAWIQKASFYNYGWGAIAFTVNNKAYAGIPYKDGSLFQFNPTANNGLGEWVKLNGLNFPAIMYSSQIVINNKAYIIGGQTTSGDSTSNCWEFDPTMLTIKQKANAPSKFTLAPSFTLNGKAYILQNGSLYQFDPVLNSWTFIYSTPFIRGTYNAAVINGVAYAWTNDGTVYKLIL